MRRLIFILVMAMGLWWAATLSSPTFETTALESRSSELRIEPGSTVAEESRDLASESPDLEAPPVVPATPPVLPPRPREFPDATSPRNRDRSQGKSGITLAPYRRNLQFENGRSSLQALTLRALPAEAYRENLGPAIHERQGMVYYQPLQPSAEPFSLKEGFPVFEKGSSGLLGFWTGVFHVRLTPQGRPDVLARKYGLNLTSYDTDLQWAALRSEHISDLQGLLGHLRAEPAVTETTLEIVFALKESR
ncbi:MAG: hypothetical protein KF789_13575 [Bdellovibrionaceae bacterium]|nr:hypothetical protein [Pseudobdellovibrionaceae bacterium]